MKRLLLSVLVGMSMQVAHSQEVGESWKISYMETTSGMYAERVLNLPPMQSDNTMIFEMDGNGLVARKGETPRVAGGVASCLDATQPMYICLVHDVTAPLDSLNKAADIIHAYFVQHSSSEHPVLFYKKAIDSRNMPYQKVVDAFENALDFYVRKTVPVPPLKYEHKMVYGEKPAVIRPALIVPVEVVGQMTPASFQGGDHVRDRWIGENLRYPEKCIRKKVQGLVMVSCQIEMDGSVTGVKAIQSPDKSLSKEAVRLVKQMPRWNPAKAGGQEVRSVVTVPVRFVLK